MTESSPATHVNPLNRNKIGTIGTPWPDTDVRIVDVVGDGFSLDSSGGVIYDPYPTSGSAGFDLDAVGVSNGAPYPAGEYIPPEPPDKDGKSGFGDDTGCFISSGLSQK